ncbi:hypothetical protein KIN20_006693 [Parelaphostrongylus tenuis]|uniref:Uncharacterized protein n=1 Tax=Parelaphostrongylus tenuis TaxID=148309 RepID=A0AAD5M6G4_PARTN|nr:hypothetical protein KIN20_006693 [Parelaphostrongylus tenuis]
MEQTGKERVEREYDRQIQHLIITYMEAKNPIVIRRYLFPEILQLIHQCKSIRELVTHVPINERCREEGKKDLKERTVAVMTEDTAAGRPFASNIDTSPFTRKMIEPIPCWSTQRALETSATIVTRVPPIITSP